MGVYYFFYNTRLCVDNTKDFHGECSWVAKLGFDDSEYYFKKVLELNNDWLKTDKIIAHTDYNGYPTYVYENGELIYQESETEEIYSYEKELEFENLEKFMKENEGPVSC
jgi:regulatory protein YycI of two-component signal transduction system YycFG